MDKKTFGIIKHKTEFEIELCTTDEHAIAKTFVII